MGSRATGIAARISLTYVVAAGLWIVLSDRVLAFLVPSSTLNLQLQTVKGWGFVLVTAFLLYLALRDRLVKWDTENTGRRQAEAAFEAQQRLHASLVESLAMGVLIVDTEETVTMANPAAESIFGMGKGGLAGRNLREFFDDEEFSRVRAETQKRSRGETSTYETIIRRLDGEAHHVQVTAVPQYDAQGTFAGALGTFQDITDRVMLKRRLDEERAQLLTLVNNLPDAVYLKDTEGRFLLANPALALIMNTADPQNLVGKTDYDFYPRAQADEYAADERRLVRDGEPLLNKPEPKTVTGSLRWITTTKVPIVGEDRKVTGLVGISRDFTERRVMEESLRESEEHYRNTFVNAPFGVFQSTRDGKLIRANPAFALMMGYDSAEELIETVNSRNMAEVLYENPGRRQAVVDEALRAGGWQRFENRYRRKDGRVIKGVLTLRPYTGLGASGVELEGFVEDVSERERAEEERKKLQDQLLQAQKMEAVGRLAGGIAHDFNNILTAIYGYCEIGLTGLPGNDLFVQIRQSAARAANLISQLLAFSRRRILQPRTLDLGELVARLMSMLKRLLGEDVEVRARTGEGLWSVRADPGQIDQVVMNLAVNSRDAMPSGGVLTIETGNIRLERDFAGEHPDVKKGEYVVLTVSDTGHGMDAATLSRIYEPFFTTKDVGKGTGLGLSTVYGIVAQSGGSISCDSEVGTGTTFRIYLPRWDGPAERAVEAEPSVVVERRPGETIMVVDDDDAVRAVAEAALQIAGYAVVSAKDGMEALQLASTLPSAPDLLIADMIMPRLSGHAAAQELTARFPSLRVLYMSGYTRDAMAHQELVPEGVDFLQKPFAISDLIARVRSALEDPRARP